MTDNNGSPRVRWWPPWRRPALTANFPDETRIGDIDLHDLLGKRMNAPPIVQASLLTILKLGLLNIRREAWRKNSERCAIEADHLHNIPGLLEDFTIDLLKYYIDIERPRYVKETDDQVLEEIRNAWTDLTHWLSKQ